MGQDLSLKGNEAAFNAGHCKACSMPLQRVRTLGSKNGFELLPCEQCGTVTVAPFPTMEELLAFYQSYKGTGVYAPKEARKIRNATRRIRRLLPKTKGLRFLDVGCNIGYTVKAAINLGLEAHGIDLDADAVARSREAYGQHYTAISVQDYAKAGHKADIIYTSEVIEHVPDADSFVAALATILDKNGILYLTTPDGGHWNKPREFTEWNAVVPPEHIIYFTKAGLRHLFTKHGFTNVCFRQTYKPGIRMTARKAS